jgi:hypothetical protein
MNWTHKAHRLVITFLVLLVATLIARAQDPEVRAKQTDLKNQYNETKQKQQVIKEAAADKSSTTSSLRRRSRTATTGYDYTMVKGYMLTNTNDRVDQLFKRGADAGLLEGFKIDGPYQYPNRRTPGAVRTTRVTVYYVEATPEERATGGVNDFDIIEVRMSKEEQIPPEDVVGDDASSEGIVPDASTGETNYKDFSLAGSDLWTIIEATDPTLYDDILARRTIEQTVALPSDLFMPNKRGPFVVMTTRDLETSTSRFNDFWSQADTLVVAARPVTVESPGPLYTGRTPLLYPDDRRVQIKNPETKRVKVEKVTFVGENADMFKLRNPFRPFLMAEKGASSDSAKLNLEFDYVGDSPYETKGLMYIETDTKQNQYIDILANPGVYPTDIVVIDASLDKIELRSPSRSSFAPDWKLFYNIGSPEVNLPRWASGISSIGVGYRNDMAVGIVLPMKANWTDFPSPLAFKNNLFSSPGGYTISFNFTFGFPFALGGNLMIANDFDFKDPYEHLDLLKTRRVIPTEKDYYNDFFHIGSIGQVFYPIMFKDKQTDPSFLFKLDLGGGFMQVKRDHYVDGMVNGKFVPYSKEGKDFVEANQGKMITLGRERDVFDVYMHIAFINLAAKNNYSIGLQYFGGSMMAEAWLELTDWLRVEMKYSFLLRDKEVWENESNYFLVTPRFRIGIPSIFN